MTNPIAATTLQALTAAALSFRDARDWQQFHSPKNLAAAISIEASELQEALLWKSDTEVAELLAVTNSRELVADEVADVLIYALLFAHSIGIDPSVAINRKLAKNETKYPVERSKGSARKYTEYDSGDEPR